MIIENPLIFNTISDFEGSHQVFDIARVIFPLLGVVTFYGEGQLEHWFIKVQDIVLIIDIQLDEISNLWIVSIKELDKLDDTIDQPEIS